MSTSQTQEYGAPGRRALVAGRQQRQQGVQGGVLSGGVAVAGALGQIVTCKTRPALR